MKKAKQLFITLPNPCHEDWEKMAIEEKGRFCNSCQKTVIDFTLLSDTELFNYFKSLKTITCGRFHDSQLNKPILPIPERKRRWTGFYKSVAAFFAFITFKSTAQAIEQKTPVTVMVPSWKEVKPVGDFVAIISGVVKDSENSPLEKAIVKFNDSLVAETDKNGFYQFEVKDLSPKSYIISISYTGLAEIVRSYHPAMLSSTYDAILYKPAYGGGGGSRGGVSVFSINDFPTYAVCFKASSRQLDKDMKKTLSELATTMRNNPQINVRINAYLPYLVLGKSRQSAIKDYLVNSEGISAERIFFSNKQEKIKQFENVIEIVSEEQ